jgi:hypothetical protein
MQLDDRAEISISTVSQLFTGSAAADDGLTSMLGCIGVQSSRCMGYTINATARDSTKLSLFHAGHNHREMERRRLVTVSILR